MVEGARFVVIAEGNVEEARAGARYNSSSGRIIFCR